MKIEDILKTSKTLTLSKKTVVNLIYTSNQVNYKLNDALKPSGISLQQFNVLRILRGQKGKASTLANIQERMITKMSNTTRLIDKLIIKGYVEREINKENKRKINITITKNGLKLLSEIDALIDDIENQMIAKLTNAETLEFNRLLEKIRLIAN